MSFVYDSAAQRSPAIDEIYEIWRYRDLLGMLISNSIKTRYKRSALGVLWTLLNPLLNTLVLTIAWSQFLRFQVENYPIYLLVGLLVWNFFSQTVLHSMNTLIWGSSLMKRIYVPRTVFTLSVLGNGLVNLLLALIPLLVIMLAMSHPIRLSFAMLPFAILLAAMFTLGFTLLVSILAVMFVDFVDMFGVLIQAWFFLTPIIYPISIVPEWVIPYMKLNPMFFVVDIFRSLIYYGQMPSVFTWGILTGIAVISFILGWLLFTRKADELAYRL